MKRVLNLITGQFYDGDMLYRYCRNIRASYLGNESQSIDKFLDLGGKIKEMGGLFVVDYCQVSTRIIGAYIQHKIEIDLLETYGKRLYYLDGTHGTTRYISK
jgi:hypothetical protein